MRQTESTHQCKRRTLHEEKSVGTGDENEGLRDDCNLEVNYGMQLLVIVVDMATIGDTVEMGVELILEEVRLEDHDNKNDPTQTIRL